MIYAAVYIVLGILAGSYLWLRGRDSGSVALAFRAFAAISVTAVVLVLLIHWLISNDVSDATAMLFITGGVGVATLLAWRYLSQF